jgi:D-beta-D-heptose 7-phosphate kinase/D-beta-D-heptose 1-phosphate adenosyltransferase
MLSFIVIGDIILDINLMGIATRIAQESPIPITVINNKIINLGGCANVSNNLSTLDCIVYMVGVIGDDDNGMNLLELATNKNINVDGVIIDKKRVTTSKYRIYSNNKLESRHDYEDRFLINEKQEHIILKYVEKLIDTVDGIIFSDYMNGVLTHNICQTIINMANSKNKYVFSDPRGNDFMKFKNSYLIKPNKKDASIILNEHISNEYDVVKTQVTKIKKILQCQVCLLTLGEDGMIVIDNKNNIVHYKTNDKKEIIDVTGAGDTVISIFAYEFIKTKHIQNAVKLANYCGGLKVGHIGTYAPTMYDLFMYEKNKLITLDTFCSIHKNIVNKKIVFTNGCFDILHYGHIMYLRQAKQLGDILIVGLNSDSSIKQLKGINRPYNCELYRIEQLKELECIDFIIIFDELSPIKLLEHIKPDFYVKGGDYNIEQLNGKKYAKETIILDYIENISTTHIINYLSGSPTTHV